LSTILSGQSFFGSGPARALESSVSQALERNISEKIATRTFG